MILVCGEVILDLLRDPGQDIVERPTRFVGLPGGSPANTAVALARLGSHAGLCARISRSSLGALLREHLSVNGVDLTYALDAKEPASLAFVDVGADGSAGYSFYVEGTADWQWKLDELPASLPAAVSALHAGSVAVAMRPGRSAIADLLTRERGRRMLSLDPNVRPALIGSAGDARDWIEALVASVDLVKASDDDVAWLYPGDSVDDVAARWRSLGPSVVVVTLGPNGALGYLRGERISRPARHVDLVDTVGAGDSYAAALLHWLERERLTTQVSRGELQPGQLGAALDFAGAVAAITCSRAGADPPRAEEVAALLASDVAPLA
ncbi:MAG: PfkB domain protein [Acidimicrobiaceae bacterium]|jgi:fructokinase|nr:PfkB domain protein [Acidimicrobiaceae bacterium]